MFDQGLQTSYMRQRIWNFLDLKTIGRETISISTFMSKTTENSKLDRVSMKGASNFEFCMKALCTSFICLPIKNQSTSFVQTNFDHFKDL